MSKQNDSKTKLDPSVYSGATKKIQIFLKQLDDFYLKNNVLYKTYQHYQTLLRLLTPINLQYNFTSNFDESPVLNLPKQVQNSPKKQKNSQRQEIVITSQSSSQQNQQNFFVKKPTIQKRSQKLIKAQINYEKADNSPINSSNKSKNDEASSLKQIRKRQPEKSIFGRQKENKLYQWILYKYDEDGTITKQQILRQAIILSKDEKFDANPAWYQSFIHKYPSLLRILNGRAKKSSTQREICWDHPPNKNLTRKSNDDYYQYSRQFQPQKRVKRTTKIIDLNESESFEQIKKAPHNELEEIVNSSVGEVEEQIQPKSREINQNEDFQLKMAVERFENALKGHKSTFLTKNTKKQK